jgi:TolA-binding protein
LLVDDPVNATEAAAAAFTANDAGHTDETRWAIAQLVGPVLRDRLDNPQAAARLWTDATAQLKSDSLRASAAIRAADVLLNDLLLAAEAKTALDFAQAKLAKTSSVTRSRYSRVLGDWYARGGNKSDARAEYSKADSTRLLDLDSVKRTAVKGAHSRSAEAFLRSNDLSRAKQELDQWQTDFPGDKAEGYLSLLQVRYQYARQKYAQAMSIANDLLVVNPRSPYADRLVFMTAKCHEATSRIPIAIATHRALVKEYPGSPLVEISKREIERLTSPAELDQDR